MPSMEITTNIGCRVGCTYCPQDKIIEAYAKRSNIFQMSLDTFRACIDKMPVSVAIYFSGMGEAWLNPDCTKMLLYAYKKGHKIGVFTTLMGVTPADIDLIKDIPFVVFCVHLPSEEKSENIKVDENYLGVLTKVAQSKISPSYVVFQGRPQKDAAWILKNKKIDCLKVCSRGRNIEMKGRIMPEKRRGPVGCVLNLRNNMLLPNGDVTLCCVDYGMQHVLGNLLTSDYNSLFKSKEFLSVKRALRDESLDCLCRYCEEYGYNKNVISGLCLPLIYKLKNFRAPRVAWRFFRNLCCSKKQVIHVI